MTNKPYYEDFPITFTGNQPVIHLPQRLTILEAVPFSKAYQDLLHQNGHFSQVYLDFEQTQFLDSSGVGALVRNYKVTQEQGATVILKNVRPPVMAVLSMTGLDQVFIIEAWTEAEPETNRATISRSDPQPPATHPSTHSWVKRAIDIIGSLMGLAITGVLFIPIALAIKLDSPGPIFFGQTRCGWMGKQFRIWKFRSMCTNAEAMKNQIQNEASGAIFKNQNDPRITKVGRFLRRTSLDELPQFWNVLKGEMSLVGTRPPTPDEVERYQVPEWQRLDVKPGITGEWQVYGRSQVKNFEDVIQLDLRYQNNWSLKYDLQLILKTITVLFDKNNGAY
ncbi:MAG: sugar transferase [Chroococcales cyanobacterium]